jgi:ribosomal protein S7
VTTAGASRRRAHASKSARQGQDADIDVQILREVIFTTAPIRRSRSRIVSACAFDISVPTRPSRRSAQVSAYAIADIAMRTAFPESVGVERRVPKSDSCCSDPNRA